MKIKGHVTVAKRPSIFQVGKNVGLEVTEEQQAQLKAEPKDFLVGIDNNDGTSTILCVALEEGEMGVELSDVIEWLSNQKGVPK